MPLSSLAWVSNAAPLPEPPAMTRARARQVRTLVETHWAFVGRVLRRLGISEADLDDALQQVFLVGAEKLDDIHPGSERAFLASTAMNIASRVHRARGRSREVAGEVDGIAAAPSPEDQIDRERALAWLDQILIEMDTDLRSVFVLYEIEEMTMAEIAVAMAIPAGTVASRLRRAREQFHDRAAQLRAPRTAQRGRP